MDYRATSYRRSYNTYRSHYPVNNWAVARKFEERSRKATLHRLRSKYYRRLCMCVRVSTEKGVVSCCRR
ncbi:hypothetical protein C8Q79DRAFT_424356 [Trametes meyenii]|nr:hypothetical protein C8Q79DRAFT_424356 [Trametes meyenii]